MNPNSILGRYLSKQIILNFLGVLLMVLGVVFIFELIEMLRRSAGHDEADFLFVIKMSLAKLPQTVDMVFPFVMMIAAMITFWRLSKSNEFVIIRAAGVSIWGFLFPVLITTFLVGIINITVVNPISSKMYELYETMDYRFKTRNPNAVLFTDKGLWTREAVNKDTILVIQAKNLHQENNSLLLREVSIMEMDRDSQLIRRLEAFAATLDDKNGFELKDVKVYQAGKATIILPSVKYTTSLTMERIKENFVDPESISFWDLPNTIRFYEKSGFSALKHYLHYLSLLASPFLLCAMILIAAVFALRPNNRRGGVMFLIVGGVSTGFIVYFLSQVIYAFGLNGYIPPFMAVWTPALIAGLISVTILLHLEDG